MNSTTAIILAGGKGMRMGDLCSEVPKPMLPINGVPFLEHLVHFCIAAKFKSIVIITRHLSHVIKQYFSGAPWTSAPVSIVESPVSGTGGDLRYVIKGVDSQRVVVFNGDTVLDIPINKMIAMHNDFNASCTVALTRLQGVQNENAIWVGESCRVVHSQESSLSTGDRCDMQLVKWKGSSTGAYVFQTDYLKKSLFEGLNSLEKEIVPIAIDERVVYAFDNESRFFCDFGTPERYRQLVKSNSEIVSSIYY